MFQEHHQAWGRGKVRRIHDRQLRLHIAKVVAIGLFAIPSRLFAQAGFNRIELRLPLAPSAEISSERMLFSISNDYHNQLVRDHAMGLAGALSDQSQPLTIHGSVSTKYVPGAKRRLTSTP